jgi:parallel beta-helix repeat protein
VRRPGLSAVLTSAAAALLATGCSSGSTSSAKQPLDPCAQVARDMLSLTQRYVDTFNVDQTKVTTSPSPTPSMPASRAPAGITPQQYTDGVSAARQRLAASHCDQTKFHDALAAGLPGVKSQGAIATAVLAQLRASLTNTLASSPVTRRVTPHDDLPEVLAQIPDGSTVQLSPGTFRLTDSLVLLRPVTLRGAGRNASVITSAAPDATVLVMTGGAVSLDSLSVRRVGSTPGSGVVTGPTAQLSLRAVAVTGARAGSDGSGGVGVLLTSSGGGTTSKSVTLRAVDSQFSDNAAAGVAAGGTHRTAISSSRFERNGQCGICFLGAAGGDISDSTFVRNSVAIVVGSNATPTVRGNHVTGGQVGIQASGSAQPIISDNTINGVARASMLFIDTSAGRVDGNDCSGDRAGIAVARSAYPYVGHNACRVTLGS